MNYDALMNSLNEFNNDELFYKDYYEAKQDHKSFQHFIDNIDMADATERRLIMPDVKGSFVPFHLGDDVFFWKGSTHNTALSKHNRYTPVFVHEHFFFEIIYVLSGSCTNTIHYRDIHLTEGQFCLISPGTQHSISVFDSSLIINIYIRHSNFETYFYNLLTGSNTLSQFFNSSLYGQENNAYMIIDSKKDEEIRDLVLFMFNEYMKKDNYYESILDNALMILLSKLAQKYEDTFTLPSITNKYISSNIVAYIYQNYRDMSLEDISEHFHFTPEHCSRLIKQQTGQTFTKMLQSIRLSKSCYLLESTDNPIAEVSRIVGYENVEHFNRQFKKLYGMTPGAYRAARVKEK